MTPVENLEERLAAQDEEWGAAPAPTGNSNELPPDGTYQALVRGFDFFESKAGTAYLKTELEIALDLEYEGRSADTIHQLEPRSDQTPEQWRKSLSFLKGHLKTLGIDVTQTPLSQVRPGTGVLDQVLDVPVEIRIVTSEKTNANGEPYRNVYVNERLGDSLGSPAASDVPADTSGFEPAPVVNPDDIPF